ncbi:unnamed protein product, partial [Ectocarpus sp. 8 AP-2014]
RQESAAGRVIGEDGAQQTAEGTKRRETDSGDGEGVLRARHPTAHGTRQRGLLLVLPVFSPQRCHPRANILHTPHRRASTREGRETGVASSAANIPLILWGFIFFPGNEHRSGTTKAGGGKTSAPTCCCCGCRRRRRRVYGGDAPRRDLGKHKRESKKQEAAVVSRKEKLFYLRYIAAHGQESAALVAERRSSTRVGAGLSLGYSCQDERSGWLRSATSRRRYQVDSPRARRKDYQRRQRYSPCVHQQATGVVWPASAILREERERWRSGYGGDGGR